ncbi:MAG: histidine--tRNA ligase [Flavobacteriaceae bacterium]|jgi:histidyl-tRNA synthetase|nr:histidine--tRNA ligase [Pelagibacteraceae bacterium]MBT4644938.1 histidine--tRNA ligase [Pelagibacteraceae bacterium]MBT4959386.1 histidine--tRNA ligase [Flavobacteriaceae bacterium]MBT5214391.1 histidine--tRNA ligase [Pelagibacteraceae bacterium]MBT6354136.1 histidine--tRNA ligase [Pelagibacteraceae bacterium]
MKINPIRGAHDLFGEEINKFNKIISEVKLVASQFSFNELITPIFEYSELFKKPLGEQSDVVLKEMYTFKDRNDDEITLRPEYTTPMIRAVISNGLLNNLPAKFFGTGQMFRRERPQKGRYRQFNQINFENFGSNDLFADIEIINLANIILKKILPNNNIKLHINSLGSRENLKDYKKILSNFFNENKNSLSRESIDKINSNPLRILDSKNKEDIEVVKKSPKLIEFLSKDNLKNYEEIKKCLINLEIPIYEDSTLVRGLDYYCNTVFEFKTDEIGSQDTLIGGGRYNGLIKTLGGKDLPGVGWAGGIERIMLLMDNVVNLNQYIHFAILDPEYKTHALKAYDFLIKNNYSVYWNYKFNLKKSLSIANEKNANYVVIIGESENINDNFSVKNLKNGNQEIKNLSNLLDVIK